MRLIEPKAFTWQHNLPNLWELVDASGGLAGHVVKNSRGVYAAWVGPSRLGGFDSLDKAKRLVEAGVA